MTHVYSLAEANLHEHSIVTIGVFDGVHKGHQHLIKRLVDEAHAIGQLAVVLTFFPHPDIVLRGLKGRYYLTTAEQKADLLTSLGVDCVVTHPFNDTVRQVRAADFVDELVQNLKMSALWVGSDFAMGYKREGNVPFLREQGTQKGFTVHDIDLIEAQGGIISSSVIRQAIENGEMEKARAWLNRAYSVTGEVVHGEKRGRQIGYPTANTAVWDEQVLPANGIYAGWARLGNERFMAMTNVGVRPTFEGKNITVEPYLLDFNRDIYGQQLEVSFEKRLRPEAKFDNLKDLIDQIARDVEVGRAYLESLKD
ncbi:MAG: bifunctional riboflavin kinase/FAD synthetase [Anaerolineae bacterium]|nr:bifunctional riboflavin kinase/FAD synthetase [Anaerolineae bacterium]